MSDEITRERVFWLLGNLYGVTEYDWVLGVSHILTEPTCPTATLMPDMAYDASGRRLSPPMRFRADCDTIDEAINVVLSQAYKYFVLGEPYEDASPMPCEPLDDKWRGALSHLRAVPTPSQENSPAPADGAAR